MHDPLHDEAWTGFAGYDEMDVQEAQESQQKVMEAIGQNCEVHQGFERFGYVHAEGRQAGHH